LPDPGQPPPSRWDRRRLQLSQPAGQRTSLHGDSFWTHTGGNERPPRDAVSQSSGPSRWTAVRRRRAPPTSAIASAPFIGVSPGRCGFWGWARFLTCRAPLSRPLGAELFRDAPPERGHVSLRSPGARRGGRRRRRGRSRRGRLGHTPGGRPLAGWIVTHARAARRGGPLPVESHAKIYSVKTAHHAPLFHDKTGSVDQSPSVTVAATAAHSHPCFGNTIRAAVDAAGKSPLRPQNPAAAAPTGRQGAPPPPTARQADETPTHTRRVGVCPPSVEGAAGTRV